MATRKEIREGMSMIHLGRCLYPDEALPCEGKYVNNDICLDCVMEWLNARVVIKVEREEKDPCDCCEFNDEDLLCHGVCLEKTQYEARAGYEAVEPLIKKGG